MSPSASHRFGTRSLARPNASSRARRWRNGRGDDAGFTLIELLIVTTILPLVIGGLSVGLLAVFSLQSSVSNRLGQTGDAQVVSANFQTDVQSASSITTETGNTQSQCGPAGESQLVGLAWKDFSNVISYAAVQAGSQWNLVRYNCASGFSTSNYTSSIISYDVLPACSSNPSDCALNPANYQAIPEVTFVGDSDPQASPMDWTSTVGVAKVVFPLSEPNTASNSVGSSSYDYTLAAVPADSAAVTPTGGSPIAPTTTAGCNFASPDTGTYASTLCLVDFSNLTGNNLVAAESGCLELSVNLPGGSRMYFCIGITGTVVKPAPLPTWSNAFLGNSCSGSTDPNSCSNGSPFYTGISGDPALYQTAGGTTTITISGISVLNATNQSATGWEVVGADAESTDSSESVTFQSTTPLTIMPNGETFDTPSDPVGNACNSGAGITTSANNLKVTCSGATTSGVKTGALMVWAPASTTTTPLTFTTTLVGNGLEAMAFGVLLS